MTTDVMARLAQIARLGVCCLALISWVLPAGLARAEEPPLEVAIFPTLSAKSLLEMYEPLRAALQQRLHRPVYFSTARDFATFAHRTQAREFPYVITAAHLARLAQVEAGYRPVLRMNTTMNAAFLVAKDSPVKTIQDLRGQSIGTPDPLALATMAIKDALLSAGLDPVRDVHLTPHVSHNAAILSVLRGENVAAGVWEPSLIRMGPEVAAKLRKVGDAVVLPMATLLLAGSRQPATEVDEVHRAIFDYAATPEGKEFFQKTAYYGVSDVDPVQFQMYDRYLPLVRSALGLQ